MNSLALDWGTKRIGLAYSVKGIIAPLPSLINDDNFLSGLQRLIDDHQINIIYVGLNQGPLRPRILEFVSRLSTMLELPVQTVEEQLSTIEAEAIFKANFKKKKHYHRLIDSLAAAVILRRALG